ncbi:MAG: DUF4876 domain-containing protein [Sphingobacterium sp.]
MKKSNSILSLSLVLLTLFTLSSCKKDKNSDPSVDFTVVVTYPETYNDTYAQGVTVELTNAFTGSKAKATTDSEGKAYFESLLPGAYSITANLELSPQQALEQVGQEEEISLNLAHNNQQIDVSGNSIELRLTGSPVGGFVIKEIYYAGAVNTNGSDAFYEIYNNSTEVLYADSLCIGDIVGKPYVSASSIPSGFKSDEANIYFLNILMIPGSGTTYPVEPGKSILIARSAINHKSDAELGNPNSPVNLGSGIEDFEAYWDIPATVRDVDNADVPNLTIHFASSQTMFDWWPTVFGPSIAIFKHHDPKNLPQFTQPGTTSSITYPQLPVEYVIDAVDCIRNPTVTDFKRLPTSIDAGFQSVSNNNSGESIRRKVKTTVGGRRVLQDTNNSTNDFEVLNTPTPKAW